MTVVLSVEPAASAPALRLRPWRGEDAAALVAAHRDPLLRRWLTTSLVSEADARRWIDDQDEGWAAGVRFSFAILERGGDVGGPVGHIAVKGGVDPTGASAEVPPDPPAFPDKGHLHVRANAAAGSMSVE
ncbi:GNAT family N-acetyltransferase [Nonomuraea insulae]|uniref:GNAT family N-acetyltransferase n=1 Tax=Nonomuraea insulae TaxID=1616787 RepID=A0ABW1DAK7_9ACTN